MFICFEGIAGSGKTSQSRLLKGYLEKLLGKDVFLSAVYEGSKKEEISSFINKLEIKGNSIAEMFLFQSLHSVQFKQVYEAINKDQVVICDRWRYSFFAHHLHNNTFDGNLNLMSQIDFLAFGSLNPDIIILFDLPADLAYTRYLERESLNGGDGLELMNFDYFLSVSNYYRQLALENNWHIIECLGDEAHVFSTITTIINKYV